ncbi:hypothetical protein F8G81_07565 [Arthrobacter sp. CDRTa11]|uniref:hypothetical protein n=1 Tax=Arthrobacter sp. CDRTa11 TaxID=2651199 RepID=UPI002265D992|nr:hypothetical protein [Arthrobacter sp. CDRTa11]UZX02491.1 hypothetical protein F8G81_07565 [Arthrobacter sp. CDRTa11]
MDVRIANAQMVKFLGTALANDLADAVAIRREAGSYWEVLERESVKDGTAWTQIGSKILVADGSPEFVDYIVVSGCPDIYIRRMRAQSATLSEVVKIGDPKAKYLLLLSMARAWETCEGWDPEWESVPIRKSAIHYSDDLADALERGMPDGAASSGIIAGGWL